MKHKGNRMPSNSSPGTRANSRWSTSASVMSAPRTSGPKANKYEPHAGAKQQRRALERKAKKS